jgi:hypothetical protein
MHYKCEHCHNTIKIEYPNIIHAGFNDSGFMYCNQCGDILTWSSYDNNYIEIVGSKHSWMLTVEEKNKVENAVISCDCNGISYLMQNRDAQPVTMKSQRFFPMIFILLY